MRRRLIRWLASALTLAAVAGVAVINLSKDDPARWHVYPGVIVLRGTPNEFLAAAPGTTAAAPHLVIPVLPGAARDVLGCFDRVARARPRVAALAGDVDSLSITYVQRSRIIGFPDYITVAAVPLATGLPEGGTGLVVYSRSRYGHGDFGVNERRVTAWLKDLQSAC